MLQKGDYPDYQRWSGFNDCIRSCRLVPAVSSNHMVEVDFLYKQIIVTLKYLNILFQPAIHNQSAHKTGLPVAITFCLLENNFHDS